VTPPIKVLSGGWQGLGLQPIPFVEINPTFSPLISVDQRLTLNLKDLELSLIPFIDISVYRARYALIVSYVLSDLMTTIYISILKQKFILIFESLVSKNHWLCHKTHVDCSSLNTLGGKALVRRSAIIVCSRLMVWYWIFSFHNTSLKLNHDVFDMNTRLVVVGIKYCQLTSAVWLMWIFNAVFHS
jgi:hypothetical protein